MPEEARSAASPSYSETDSWSAASSPEWHSVSAGSSALPVHQTFPACLPVLEETSSEEATNLKWLLCFQVVWKTKKTGSFQYLKDYIFFFLEWARNSRDKLHVTSMMSLSLVSVEHPDYLNQLKLYCQESLCHWSSSARNHGASLTSTISQISLLCGNQVLEGSFQHEQSAWQRAGMGSGSSFLLGNPAPGFSFAPA